MSALQLQYGFSIGSAAESAVENSDADAAVGREFCHSADAPSPSLLERLPKGEGKVRQNDRTFADGDLQRTPGGVSFDPATRRPCLELVLTHRFLEKKALCQRVSAKNSAAFPCGPHRDVFRQGSAFYRRKALFEGKNSPCSPYRQGVPRRGQRVHLRDKLHEPGAEALRNVLAIHSCSRDSPWGVQL